MEDLNLEEMKTGFTPEQAKGHKWAAFIESDVVNFFTGFKMEKMSLEDGNGRKAKLSRLKDGGIKVEYTSSITL